MLEQDQPQAASTFWLRRHDQLSVGVLAVVALVVMAVSWLALGGLTGGLVEIDRAPHREAPFRVDLNTATWPELAQLPGIGETLARRIVSSRASDGPFTSHDALLRVTGVGAKKLERIKPFLLPIEKGSGAVQNARPKQ